MPVQDLLRSRRYLGAIVGVGIAFLVRLWLRSVLGEAIVFGVFYPVIILTAYFGGAGPAILAAVLSAGLGYYAFAPPAFTLAPSPYAVKSLIFFVINAGVNIFFVVGMTRATNEARMQRRRAEMLAEGHADLFREFNARTTNHLQLVSALLQTRAADALGGDAAGALAEASKRSFLLSQVHRSLQDERDSKTDFAVFARQLIASCLHAAGDPPLIVEVSGEETHLPADQAASLAGVVFEWLRVILMQIPARRSGRFRLKLAAEGDGFRLSLCGGWDVGDRDGAPSPSMRLLDSHIVGALVDQLGGELGACSGPEGLEWEVTFPRRALARAPAMTGFGEDAPRSIH